MKTKVSPDGEILTTVEKPFFKTPYNYDKHAEAQRTALFCLDPSKAQQHQKDETDINVIVDRFLKTGQLPSVPLPPTYENFGEIFDFQSAMDTVKRANDAFMALPAKIRNTFANNPANFVAYVDQALEAGDLSKLKEWGMTPPEPPSQAVPPDEPTTTGDTPKPPQEPPAAPKT